MAYAAVSARSVRAHHPDARLVFLTDELSAKASGAVLRRAERFAGAGTLVTPTRFEQPVLQSRYLKVTCRRQVEGPAIAIDVDTLALGPLDGLMHGEGHLATARDINHRYPNGGTPGWVLPVATAIGGRIGGKGYFNAGILRYADTPEAHAFSQTWERFWDLHRASGDGRDQVPFNCALEATHLDFEVLCSRFNAGIEVNPWQARQAHLAHYFTRTGRIRDGSMLALLAKRFLAEDAMSDVRWDALKPWVSAPPWIDWFGSAPGVATVRSALSHWIDRRRSACQSGSAD